MKNIDNEFISKLALDLASYNNMDVEPVLEKINAGLAGDENALVPLGISLPKDVSFQKRYLSLFEQTAFAHGDYERTKNSRDNVWRSINRKIGLLRNSISQFAVK